MPRMFNTDTLDMLEEALPNEVTLTRANIIELLTQTELGDLKSALFRMIRQSLHPNDPPFFFPPSPNDDYPPIYWDLHLREMIKAGKFSAYRPRHLQTKIGMASVFVPYDDGADN